jgi:hypothetical protein
MKRFALLIQFVCLLAQAYAQDVLGSRDIRSDLVVRGKFQGIRTVGSLPTGSACDPGGSGVPPERITLTGTNLDYYCTSATSSTVPSSWTAINGNTTGTTSAGNLGDMQASNGAGGFVARPVGAGLLADGTNGIRPDDSVISFYSAVSALPGSCTGYGFYYVTGGTPGQNLYQCNGSAPALVGPAATTFEGRGGAITAQSGDYSCTEVTGCADFNAANTWSQPQTKDTYDDIKLIAAPGAPLAGYLRRYAKSGSDEICVKNSAGVEVCMSDGPAGGGSQSIITAANNGFYPPFGMMTGTGSTINASGSTVNRVLVYQHTIPAKIDIGYLSVTIPTGANGAAGCKLNAAIFDAVTKTVLHEMSTPADCSTTGTKKVAVTNPGSIIAGPIFYAITANDAAVSVSSWNTSSALTGMLNTGTDNRFGFCSNTANATTTAMPSGCGTLNESSPTGLPMIVIQP